MPPVNTVPIADEYRDTSGTLYRINLRSEQRADGMWEGRLEFTSSGTALTTPAETTQSSHADVLYWAKGLGDAYFDGAFRRASSQPKRGPSARPVQDSARVDLREVERLILDTFRESNVAELPTERLFARAHGFANADVVRALDALETRSRLVLRYTAGGSDLVRLTDDGRVYLQSMPSGTLPATAPARESTASPSPTAHARQHIADHPHEISLDEQTYRAAIWGEQRRDGTWAGWIEFVDTRSGAACRTGEETSQPDRDALAYWASGLEDLYFEGALRRAK